MGRAPERAAARDAVVRACARGRLPLELLAQVAALIAPVVPSHASGWVLTDPGTMLGTGVVATNVSPSLYRGLVAHELATDDVNSFARLARRRRPVARLGAATGGHLERSSRHRRLYAPEGFGDELRAVVRTGDACWGEICLTRRADAPAFSAADEEWMAGLLGHVASGLRTALAVTGGPPVSGGPGVLVLDGDDRVEVRSEEADRWLRDLPDAGADPPPVVVAVARQARLLAAGTVSGGPAKARVRGRSGRYVLVRGTCLAGSGEQDPPAVRVAVVVEPAGRAELAPVVLALGDLTPREQQVTQLLLAGGSVPDIAQRLWISPHTLRDHVKAVFAKLRVSSRPELAALLTDQHPASPAGGPVGPVS
ncbi:helix-turn-helix transcriptional regulator [Geodermatophilus sp. SYSU D01176]